MNFGEKLKELRINKHLKQSELADALKVDRSTIGKWENNSSKPNYEMMGNIADYFNITREFLNSTEENTICLDCGFMYSPLSDIQVREHKHRHTLWEEAVDKHGFCWTFAVCNRVIRESIENYNHPKATFDIKYESVISYLKALFSKSLTDDNFSKNHANFDTYVSNKLLDKSFVDTISKDIFDKLVDEYGLSFNYYDDYNTYTIAAHKENDKEAWTDEELEEIENFKKYVLSKRINKDKEK